MRKAAENEDRKEIQLLVDCLCLKRLVFKIPLKAERNIGVTLISTQKNIIFCSEIFLIYKEGKFVS